MDFAAGIGMINVGYNHPKVVEVVNAQVDHVIHFI